MKCNLKENCVLHWTINKHNFPIVFKVNCGLLCRVRELSKMKSFIIGSWHFPEDVILVRLLPSSSDETTLYKSLAVYIYVPSSSELSFIYQIILLFVKGNLLISLWKVTVLIDLPLISSFRYRGHLHGFIKNLFVYLSRNFMRNERAYGNFVYQNIWSLRSKESSWWEVKY